MDITVARAAGDWTTWDLTDLLGRPLGCITEAPGRQFFIDLNERGRSLMPKANLGSQASLDAALTTIEKHTHGVCRLASNHAGQP